MPRRGDHRDSLRHARGGRSIQARALEHVDKPVSNPRRLRLQRAGGLVLRHLAGAAGGGTGSYRSAAGRITCGVRRGAGGGLRLGCGFSGGSKTAPIPPPPTPPPIFFSPPPPPPPSLHSSHH